MKFEKRIAALLLSLILLLTGCGNGRSSATDDTAAEATASCGNGQSSATDDTTAGATAGATGETAGNTDQTLSVNCQYLPETVENPSDLPVLKWVCLTNESFGGGDRIWNEAAATELNQMLADRDMPFRVLFVLLTVDQWLDSYLQWFDFPETIAALADADLIYGGMNAEAMVQYLSPITEYVTGTAEPSLKNAVAHELGWMAGTVDGQIYGYSTTPYTAQSTGWQIDPALLKAAGLKAEDLQRDFWDMDDVLAKLYKANGNEPFLYLPTRGRGKGINPFSADPPFLRLVAISDLFSRSYKNLAGFFAVDYSQETPAVVNWLEPENTRNAMEAILRYAAAGYAVESLDEIRLMYTGTTGEDIYVNELADGNIRIPVTKAYFTETAPEEFVSGVAAVSRHKAEAISLLNLIAEDEAFRMQLFYGKEGRDYTVENGYYSIVIHEDGSNYSLDFLSPLAYFCGLTEGPDGSRYSIATEIRWLYAKEGKTTLETYREILDQCECYYPITFDYTGMEQELAAMEKIFYNKYDVLKGSPLTEEILQMLIKDLKAAGSDKVLAELQRQLDQWLAEHPDW